MKDHPVSLDIWTFLTVEKSRPNTKFSFICSLPSGDNKYDVDHACAVYEVSRGFKRTGDLGMDCAGWPKGSNARHLSAKKSE